MLNADVMALTSDMTCKKMLLPLSQKRKSMFEYIVAVVVVVVVEVVVVVVVAFGKRSTT